jgi:glucose/arabinose dehydrogenase
MSPFRRWTCIATLAALTSCGGGGDEPSGICCSIGPPFVATEVFSALQFQHPLFLAAAPGDAQHVFVVTQSGVIYVFDNDPEVTTANVFLDLDARVTDVGGEMGVLGLAFDPDYASNGFLYVNYNPNFDDTHPLRTNISRFHVSSDPLAADPASETVLLSYEQPFGNHKGGWLDFGPDGKLYIAAGDGGSAGDPNGNAQNLGTVLGKILRINKDGTIPADNPFAAMGPSARGEIWAYGFRNPYRASFDGNVLWVADVGQDTREEIDIVQEGGNYGWRKFEGTHVYNADDPDPGNTLFPIYEYGHEEGRCSVIGGYVYRGAQLNELAGTYLFGDLCTGEIWGLAHVDWNLSISVLMDVPGLLTSFGRDAQGELYATTFDSDGGKIYKIVRGPQ